MRTNGLTVSLLFAAALACSPVVGLSQSHDDSGAKQDMRNAGHETKDAAKDVGHGVKKGTEKTYHATKNGTEKGYDKTKSGTKKAWHETENTTKGAAHGTLTITTGLDSFSEHGPQQRHATLWRRV